MKEYHGLRLLLLGAYFGQNQTLSTIAAERIRGGRASASSALGATSHLSF